MAHSIKKNFFYNILLNISKVIFPLITAPYISRVLEPDGVGLFNFANTYAGYFSLFAALGIPYYGVREIAKVRDDFDGQTRFVSEIMSLLSISTLLCVFFFIVSLLFVPQLTENHIIFLISALGLYITPLKIDWFFSGREEFGYITFRSLVIKTLSVIALFVLVHQKEDLIIYVLINALSTICNELWNFIKMYQYGVRPYFTLTGIKHLKPLLILFSSSVAISVYTLLDTLMLGFMTEYTEVGYYNSATHISRSLVPIVASLSAVVLPRLSYYMKLRDWSSIDQLMNKSVSVVSYLCFPVSFGVIAIAPVFVPLFFGNGFYGAVIPLQIISGIIISIGLNNLTGVQILVGLGLDKLFLISVLAGTFSNFFLNLVLIPLGGAAGAAISSVFAETLILAVTTVFVLKKTPIRFRNLNEIGLDCILALPLFLLEHILSQYLEGWLLVFAFVVTGGGLYVILQLCAKNKTQGIILDLLISKIKK